MTTATMNTVQLILNAKVREETLNSKKYLVAPVVMLIEGVHNGTGGPVFYPADELAKYPACWNGEPVTIHHPKDEGGQPVSANSPQVIETTVVGQLFNTMFDTAEKKLKSEIWIEIDRIRKVSPSTLSDLQSGKPIDISTGLWSDHDGVSGDWNGEAYDSTVRNFKPDHLALLPGASGACSWDDGCGVRANANGGSAGRVRKLIQGLAHAFGLTTQDTSHGDIREQLTRQINEGRTDSTGFFWIKDVFDDNFVYEGEGSKLIQQSYEVSGDGEVTVGDETEEVREDTRYVPVSDNEGESSGDPGGREEESMKKADAVTALISNEKTRFTDDHKEWLGSLSEEQLAALEPCPCGPEGNADGGDGDAAAPAGGGSGEPASKPGETDSGSTETKPEGNAQPGADKPPDLSTYVANAPPEVRSVLNRAVARDAAIKKEIVDKLDANTRCTFTRAQLEAMDLDTLETLGNLAQVTVDYSGQVGGPETKPLGSNVAPEPEKVWDHDKIRANRLEKSAAA